MKWLTRKWIGVFGIAFLLLSITPFVSSYIDCLSRDGVVVRLDKAEYAVGEEPVLTVKNYGPNAVTFGFEYKMWERVGEEWVVVPLPEDAAWPAILRILPPCRSYRQSVDLSGLSPGEYRIFKTVNDDVTGASETYVLGFKIIDR